MRVDNFIDPRSAAQWSVLSSSAPEEAASKLLKALSGSTVEDRLRIKGEARREVLGTLVRLAWSSSTFNDAVKSLALLAEAENETWSNNASGEFIGRYQMFLGGTEVPYLDRLSLLDELLREERPSLARLAVKALAQAGDRHFSRMQSDAASETLAEKEWQPRSVTEQLECIRSAIIKLISIVQYGFDDLQGDLVVAARNFSAILRDPVLQENVIPYFDAIREAYPAAREPLRRIIANILRNEQRYRKELPFKQIESLKKLHARFEDKSLAARLQQYVGQPAWEEEEQVDLTPLADELLSVSDALAENWRWLTSGDAADAWRLGQALASIDTASSLSKILPSLSGGGNDLRLLCGYIRAKREALGDDWYNSWVVSQFNREPRPTALLFEVAWRCGTTETVAEILIATLRREKVSRAIAGQLVYGGWDKNLSTDVVHMVLRALADTGHRDTAIGILPHRIKDNPTEAEKWKPLALELVTTPELIRANDTMVSHYWKELANIIVPEYPMEIASAILREQADLRSDSWFAEYSQASEVLLACVEQNPSAAWKAIQGYLSLTSTAYAFSIGFPRGVVERMPLDEVMAWISEKPIQRAATVAKFSSMDMTSDDTLASRIIGTYGSHEQVAEAFFSNYVSGGWSGEASAHWNELADALEEVARRTALPKLHHWATDSTGQLREMADRDRVREEEEKLR